VTLLLVLSPTAYNQGSYLLVITPTREKLPLVGDQTAAFNWHISTSAHWQIVKFISLFPQKLLPSRSEKSNLF
jgi:hypothetical protein